MTIRPSVLMFSGEELQAQAIKSANAEEYLPDVQQVKNIRLKAKQRLTVKGICNDGRLLVRTNGLLRVLVSPAHIRIAAAENAEQYLRRYSASLNVDPKQFIDRIS